MPKVQKRKENKMEDIKAQIEYAQELTNYLADESEVSVLDVLDAMASVGLVLQPITGENIASAAYMSALQTADN
jgi:hypothetical protein